MVFNKKFSKVLLNLFDCEIAEYDILYTLNWYYHHHMDMIYLNIIFGNFITG